MGAPEHLLAKSRHRTYGDLSLEQHLADTEEAAREIFDPSQRAAQNFLRFFRLDPKQDGELFLTSLRVAALFHDVGKANAHFYGCVARTTTDVQAVRHEHFSGLVLCLPEVKAWLSKSAALDYDAICASVLSHHLKVEKPGNHEWAWCQPRRLGEVALYLQHEEIQRTLARVAQIAALPAPPTLPSAAWSADASAWESVLRCGLRDARSFSDRLMDANEGDAAARRARQRVLAVKAALIAADGVASASFREGLSIRQWVQGTLHSAPLSRDEVYRKVIDPRTREVSLRNGKVVEEFRWHNFQIGAGEEPRRTLLLAGCGAGKTLAAWRWIATQCERRPVGRVIFLYPTRGTATEGFKDYVGWAPETEAALVHGTAGYELQTIRENPSEATRGKRFDQDETAQRLFALGHWSRRFFSATVDQFLSFIEHGYASMCLLPVLADAVIVLDEVHSYDGRMFENTLSFAKAFDVPVLAMTATLPPSRRASLEAQGFAVYPRAEHETQLEDLAEQEKHPRYDVSIVADADAAMAACETGYAKGQRVLWVVNTVARAQALAAKLKRHFGVDVLCYHSRFKLGDRQRAHRAVIEQFKTATGACLAVTTQVCEMSLDLDADVLVSELAPLSAVVQRMGRANRHLRRGREFRAQVVLYPPERAVPYANEEIAATRAAFATLGDGVATVSQRALSELLVKFAPYEATRDGAGKFLSSGWFAVPGSLRDEDDFTRPCVLDTEVALVVEQLKARESIDELTLPVPKKRVVPDELACRAGLPPWLGVARAADYDEWLGFMANAEGA
jgi:CRISPR-associated endonuclease/helicase Cas3